MSLMQFIIGMAMASVVLPMTRMYSPLERTVGFSFAYNCGYGVLGGTSAMVATQWKSDLGTKANYAAPFYLTIMAFISIVGCVLVRFYAPRLNKRHVGHLE